MLKTRQICGQVIWPQLLPHRLPTKRINTDNFVAFISTYVKKKCLNNWSLIGCISNILTKWARGTAIYMLRNINRPCRAVQCSHFIFYVLPSSWCVSAAWKALLDNTGGSGQLEGNMSYNVDESSSPSWLSDTLSVLSMMDKNRKTVKHYKTYLWQIYNKSQYNIPTQ